MHSKEQDELRDLKQKISELQKEVKDTKQKTDVTNRDVTATRVTNKCVKEYMRKDNGNQ